jgi:hypothetical protein
MSHSFQPKGRSGGTTLISPEAHSFTIGLGLSLQTSHLLQSHETTLSSTLTSFHVTLIILCIYVKANTKSKGSITIDSAWNSKSL